MNESAPAPTVENVPPMAPRREPRPDSTTTPGPLPGRGGAALRRTRARIFDGAPTAILASVAIALLVLSFNTLGNRIDDTNDRIDDRFDDTNARFADRFDAIDTRFADVDDRFDAVDARFAHIDDRFADVNNRFADVNNRITTLEQRLDARITRLENTMDTRFNRVDARLSALERHTLEISRDLSALVVALGARSGVDDTFEEVSAATGSP